MPVLLRIASANLSVRRTLTGGPLPAWLAAAVVSAPESLLQADGGRGSGGCPAALALLCTLCCPDSASADASDPAQTAVAAAPAAAAAAAAAAASTDFEVTAEAAAASCARQGLAAPLAALLSAAPSGGGATRGARRGAARLLGALAAHAPPEGAATVDFARSFNSCLRLLDDCHSDVDKEARAALCIRPWLYLPALRHCCTQPLKGQTS